MKIVVINGSPKGELGVTIQYARYLELNLPGHSWTWHQVGERIAFIEKHPEAMTAIVDSLAKADLLLWVYPLYHHLVSAQHKRFIELVESTGAQACLAGKYAAAISSSIHYFDHNARNYIHAISEDWGMQFVGAHCVEMDDLRSAEKRHQLVNFGKSLETAVTQQRSIGRMWPALDQSKLLGSYQTGPLMVPLNLGGRSLTILADIKAEDHNQDIVRSMADRLAASVQGGRVNLVDLAEFRMQGPCLGCCKCGLDNECAWDGKDGYRVAFETYIEPADMIIFVGAMHDRFLSGRFKQFFDRSFVRTHQPYLVGKQIAWVVAGPLGQEANLRQIMEIYPEVMRGNLAGMVSSELASSAELDARIDGLMASMVELALNGYIAPQTSLGLSGHLVFRDAIWGHLRAVFQGDYRYFRKTKQFDYPQKKWLSQIINQLMWMVLKLPPLRKGFRSMIREMMSLPYRKIVEAAKKTVA